MKSRFSKIILPALLVLLSVGLFFRPVEAEAATETASNLEELAVIVNKHGVKRDTDFSVKYTGSKKDMEYVVNDEYYTFFFKELVMADDPSTSDDADYLAYNLDLYSGKHDLYYQNGTIYFKLYYYESLSQTKKVNEKVPDILSKLKLNGKSNYEKVKAIHDYICELITYSYTGKDIESTMYGAVTNGKALCNAYALCMYKLLVEAGVPCKIIGGTAGTGRDSGGHAWNIVALGDKWYYVDLTWDDSPEDRKVDYCYDYFLKGSSDFDSADPSEKHKLDPAIKSDEYSKAFPVEKKSFNAKTMSDVNKSVTIGNSDYKNTTETGKDTEQGKDNKDNKDNEKDNKDKDTKDNKDKDNKDTKDSSDKNDTTDNSKGKYTWNDIVKDVYSESYSFSIKKGRYETIFIDFRRNKDHLVESIEYKITSGKNNIKMYDYDILEDRYGVFAYFDFKGKNSGSYKLKITVTLTNGQKISHVVSGRVR